jgi:hypothetical protein
VAVQAQAQTHGSALGVSSGKAAIDRFAGRLTYQIASGRSTAPMSWQVSACRAHGDGTVCTGEWTFTGETCSVRMEALRAGSSLHVRELGKLACSREGATESGVAPAP